MKRQKKNAVPVIPPFLDQFGRPAWSNPFGHYRSNPALTGDTQPAPVVAAENARAVLPAASREGLHLTVHTTSLADALAGSEIPTAHVAGDASDLGDSPLPAPG